MKRILNIRLVVIIFIISLYMNIVACTSLQTLTRVYTKADFTNSLGMGFNKIPAGAFIMGSPKDELGREEYDFPNADETQHQVTLTKPFYIQTTEVTQGQWKALMKKNPSQFKSCGNDCPVEWVLHYNVDDFIKKLNKLGEGTYRLPTEAEWEYAARAGTITPFNTGKCLSTDDANFKGNNPLPGCPSGSYRGTTMPVASFAPNAWGIYDMHGNVMEWVQDEIGNYPSKAVIDPVSQSLGSPFAVIRGGSYFSNDKSCRSASRFFYAPSKFLSGFVGFRLVLDQIPESVNKTGTTEQK